MITRMTAIVSIAATLLCISFVEARFEDPTPNEALKKSLPQIDFHGVSIAKAINFLCEITKARIEVDWDALKSAGVTKEDPVELSMTNKTLAEAIDAVLARSGAKEKLAYRIDGEVIRISTAAKLEED